ncbi:MAG: UDP-N-acetylglucosamine 2-epimerase (non-hydrolyzing) [Flavobacteriales bacterium]|nr:UDP-N-acetylglucosamine 2-epimerase (non-hydrolyzing) [Flavobacteriales bacterium]
MTKKILTIIGARPQIIKSAAISKAVRTDYSRQLSEVIVHTGQHYDINMSDVFFVQMSLPEPSYNLGVGSGSHGTQTAAMLSGLEKIMLDEQPAVVLVYGDTNSTLAAAMAAAKLKIPLVHVEAGLRSFNKAMPEEINRIMCDHASTLLFSPTLAGMQNLAREGFDLKALPPYSADHPGVFHCGDVMYDNALYFAPYTDSVSNVLRDCGINSDPFVLATIHRDNNTDDPHRLRGVIEALVAVADALKMRVVWPMHPRTRKMCEQSGIDLDALNKQLNVIPPATYLDMLHLEKNCTLVITDSGGVQKEAYYFKKPCIILRSETEWIELVQNGNARLCQPIADDVVSHARYFMSASLTWPEIFGDGNAARFICSKIAELQ